MANSYDKATLSSDPVMRARYMLGDTGRLKDDAGATVWLLDQEEIDALITTFGFSEGVAQLADGLAVRFAQEPDKYADEGGVEIEWSSRINAWQSLANRLRTGEIASDISIASGRPIAKTLETVDTSGFR